MTQRFNIIDSTIRDVKVVERKPIGDSRGYLERLFCIREFAPLLSGKIIAQVNRTLTARKGTVRGLHFQRPPHAEAKLVTCIRGEVFDVAVDLRRGSPTFLKWHAEILSAETHRSILIPEGFAHGFQALTDCCELFYLHTAVHEPAAEGALNAVDPRLAIAWPLDVTEISDRDRAHPMLSKDFQGIAS